MVDNDQEQPQALPLPPKSESNTEQITRSSDPDTNKLA